MKRVAIGCGIMLAIFLVLIGLAAGVGRYRSSVKRGSWLEATFEGPYLEYRPTSLMAALLLQDRLLLREITGALDRAAEDPKIAGLVVRIDDLKTGWAQTEEIRDHIIAFRKSGKRAVCYLETAGEFSSGNLEYYLASGFDKIYLGPSGDINLVGLMAQSMFLRGTLDLLGIYPDMEHIGDYKTAMNFWTEKSFTPAHREMYQNLIESIEKTLVAGVAQGRKLREAEVRALFRKAPFLGKEALQAKLVDGVKYRDQVYEELKRPGQRKLETVRLERYLKAAGAQATGRNMLAVVYGVGAVLRGKSEFGTDGTQTMGSDTVARAFREAAEDDAIKAIVFRVDSPGGSYIASDIIWREVARAREKKPVVVSMSDLAGSGGYFVAMPATEIVAHPATLTASIGVLGGKLDVRGFYNKIGVTKDHVSLEPYADMFFDYQRFTPQQKLAQWRFLNRVYDDFSRKAAQGRHMKWEDVDRIGRGRVWTGADAKRLGLVDHLGGMDVAIARAKDLAKIPASENVRMRFYPSEKTLWQALTSRDEDGVALSAGRSLRRIAALLGRLMAAAEARGSDSVLEMSEVPEIR